MSNYPKSITLYEGVVLLFLFLFYLFAGVAATLMPAYLPTVTKSVTVVAILPLEAGAYLTSIFFIGWFIGNPAWRFLSRWISTVSSVVLCVFLYSFPMVLTGLVFDFHWILFLRLLSGIGAGGLLIIAPVYVSETWKSKTPPWISTVLIASFPLGIFLAGLTSFFITDWKEAYMIMGIIPLVVSAFSIWILKKWEKWRAPQEYATFQKLFELGHRRAFYAGMLTYSCMLAVQWTIISWLSTWAQNVSDRWIHGAGIMLFCFAGALGFSLSSWTFNRIGMRRAILLCSSGFVGMSYLLFRLHEHPAELTYLEIVWLSVLFGVNHGITIQYFNKLFSSGVRASGSMFTAQISRLFIAVVIFVTGYYSQTPEALGELIFISSLLFLIGSTIILLTKDSAFLVSKEEAQEKYALQKDLTDISRLDQF